MRKLNPLQWREVNKEQEGYGEDDSIVFCADYGPYFLRINDISEHSDNKRWTWGVFGTEGSKLQGRIIEESPSVLESAELAMVVAKFACLNDILDRFEKETASLDDREILEEIRAILFR